MKLRIKLDDKPVEILENRPDLTAILTQIQNLDTGSIVGENIQKGAEIVVEGASDMARVSREYAVDTVADVISVIRSATQIRSARDLLEHQIGVGLMAVTGTISQYERLRDVADETAKSLGDLVGAASDQTDDA